MAKDFYKQYTEVAVHEMNVLWRTHGNFTTCEVRLGDYVGLGSTKRYMRDKRNPIRGKSYSLARAINDLVFSSDQEALKASRQAIIDEAIKYHILRPTP